MQHRKNKPPIIEKQRVTLFLSRLKRPFQRKRKRRVVFVCMTGDPISWSKGAALAFSDYLAKRSLANNFSVYAIGQAKTKGFIKRRDLVISPLFNKIYLQKFPEKVEEITKLSKKGTQLQVDMAANGQIDLKRTFERILKKAGLEKPKTREQIENPMV